MGELINFSDRKKKETNNLPVKISNRAIAMNEKTLEELISAVKGMYKLKCIKNSFDDNKAALIDLTNNMIAIILKDNDKFRIKIAHWDDNLMAHYDSKIKKNLYLLDDSKETLANRFWINLDWSIKATVKRDIEYAKLEILNILSNKLDRIDPKNATREITALLVILSIIFLIGINELSLEYGTKLLSSINTSDLVINASASSTTDKKNDNNTYSNPQGTGNITITSWDTEKKEKRKRNLKKKKKKQPTSKVRQKSTFIENGITWTKINGTNIPSNLRWEYNPKTEYIVKGVTSASSIGLTPKQLNYSFFLKACPNLFQKWKKTPNKFIDELKKRNPKSSRFNHKYKYTVYETKKRSEKK